LIRELRASDQMRVVWVFGATRTWLWPETFHAVGAIYRREARSAVWQNNILLGARVIGSSAITT
jgi:hypothetical protein